MAKISITTDATPRFIETTAVFRAMRIEVLGELPIHTVQHFKIGRPENYYWRTGDFRARIQRWRQHGPRRMAKAIERVLLMGEPFNSVLVFADADSVMVSAEGVNSSSDGKATQYIIVNRLVGIK